MILKRPGPDSSVFCIPCNHPAAKDGVFHCIPSYYDSDYPTHEYEFILVDTHKIMAELE